MQIMDLENNPDLMSKSNNGALKDAIGVAKKIVDGDTSYEGRALFNKIERLAEYQKFLALSLTKKPKVTLSFFSQNRKKNPNQKTRRTKMMARRRNLIKLMMKITRINLIILQREKEKVSL
jgi:hypothetical protein